MNVKELLVNYRKQFNDYTIRNLALNWVGDDQGIRHPDGPVGVVVRGIGQVDLYAGKTRSILGVNGEFVNIATNYATWAEKISFITRDISNFRILGRSFVKEIFEGQKVLAIKPSTNIGTYSVIGPQTKIITSDGAEGYIIDSVPLPNIFDAKEIFEKPKDENLVQASTEISNLIMRAIGGLDG